jgi:hypothetical protein
MDYPEAMAALLELVDRRVLLVTYRSDGSESGRIEGVFTIGGSDPADFGAEHLPEHQLDITVRDYDEDPFALILWRLTESEHANGRWLEDDGHAVLEVTCTDGTGAHFFRLDTSDS